MALTDNLISHWKLDEASGDAVDAHGSNDLTDLFTVGSAVGKIGNARDFERADTEFFQKTDNTDLSTGDIDFTFAGWVQLESKPAGNASVIQKTTSVDGEYFLYYSSSADRFKFDVYGGAGFSSGGSLTANTLGSPSTGVWYFIVIWHDSVNNQIGMSINGVDETPVSHSAGVYDGTATFELSGSVFGNFWDGLMDSVSFWKRVLTAEERAQLYNSGLGLSYERMSATPPSTGLYEDLISHWKLDEASGQAIDAHGFNDLLDNNTVGSATGKLGNARDFEVGNSEYFTKADNTDLSTGNIDFTFAAWVQLESKATDQCVFAKGTGASGEYLLEYRVSGDEFRVRVWGSSGFGDGGAVSATTLGSPSTATWYFIVFWHDATANTLNIQVNNGTADSSSHSAGVLDGGGNFNLGSYPDFSLHWDGLIDSASFWKRVLTADERTELYNSGNGLDYDDWGAAPPATNRRRRLLIAGRAA